MYERFIGGKTEHPFFFTLRDRNNLIKKEYFFSIGILMIKKKEDVLFWDLDSLATLRNKL